VRSKINASSYSTALTAQQYCHEIQIFIPSSLLHLLKIPCQHQQIKNHCVLIIMQTLLLLLKLSGGTLKTNIIGVNCTTVNNIKRHISKELEPENSTVLVYYNVRE